MVYCARADELKVGMGVIYLDHIRLKWSTCYAATEHGVG